MNCSVEGSYYNVSFWLRCWWQTLTCFFESISGLWLKDPSTLWTEKCSRIIHSVVLSLQMRKSEAQREEFICPSLPMRVKSELGLEDSSSDFLVWGSVSCAPSPLHEHDAPHSQSLFSSHVHCSRCILATPSPSALVTQLTVSLLGNTSEDAQHCPPGMSVH